MSKSILNPTISSVNPIDNNSAMIVIEPMANGYGQTLGNSLRRVLLSSIKGAAVTAFKIDGIGHEFSTIPGVKEDVVEIMLNIKAIAVKCFSNKPVEVSLTKKGGIVTAGDIKTTADVEIINPEQLIATIDDSNTELKIDFVIESGRGYQTIEESSTKRAHSDMIALDAVFSPVRRVRYSVEKTRVDDDVDLDKLTIIVDTDGSITPADALEQAAAVLVEQYKALAGNALIKSDETEKSSEEEVDLLSLPIEELNMSARTTNALLGNEIKTVGELVNLSEEEMSNLKGFGQKAREEVKERVAELEF